MAITSEGRIESRLRERRSELERSAFALVQSVVDPADATDSTYAIGLRAALAAALDYGLEAIAAPDAEPGPVPAAMRSQARLAARNGVSLDTVIRRYNSGHAFLADTLLQEAVEAGASAAEVKASLRSLAAHYDRILAAVGEEHGRQSEAVALDPSRRRVELLRLLLAGQLNEAPDLPYEFDAHHLALVTSGPAASEALKQFGRHYDHRLLIACPDELTAWAWLGSRRAYGERELDLVRSYFWPDGLRVGCGEPGYGLLGWRLSHRQAAAALAVPLSEPVVRYGSVALLAAALRNELLQSLLRNRFLAPLEASSDGGTVAKQTLRAYFAAAGNTTSAAAALGVDRSTVRSRLNAIEDRLHCSIDTASPELQVALRLDGMESGA